jgi:hypothetical protein
VRVGIFNFRRFVGYLTGVVGGGVSRKIRRGAQNVKLVIVGLIVRNSTFHFFFAFALLCSGCEMSENFFFFGVGTGRSISLCAT